MTGDDDIEARLLAAVRDRLGVRAGPDTRLGDLGVDSVRLAGLVSDLERTFGFRAGPDIFDVETVRELAAYMREHGSP